MVQNRNTESCLKERKRFQGLRDVASSRVKVEIHLNMNGSRSSNWLGQETVGKTGKLGRQILSASIQSSKASGCPGEMTTKCLPGTKYSSPRDQNSCSHTILTTQSSNRKTADVSTPGEKRRWIENMSSPNTAHGSHTHAPHTRTHIHTQNKMAC